MEIEGGIREEQEQMKRKNKEEKAFSLSQVDGVDGADGRCLRWCLSNKQRHVWFQDELEDRRRLREKTQQTPPANFLFYLFPVFKRVVSSHAVFLCVFLLKL